MSSAPTGTHIPHYTLLGGLCYQLLSFNVGGLMYPTAFVRAEVPLGQFRWSQAFRLFNNLLKKFVVISASFFPFQYFPPSSLRRTDQTSRGHGESFSHAEAAPRCLWEAHFCLWLIRLTREGARDQVGTLMLERSASGFEHFAEQTLHLVVCCCLRCFLIKVKVEICLPSWRHTATLKGRKAGGRMKKKKKSNVTKKKMTSY